MFRNAVAHKFQLKVSTCNSGLRGRHFSTHGSAVDLEIVVIIKREIIYGENHANEVTECASGATLKAGMTESRNGEMAEWRKMAPNPKRRNDGKSPKILKDGITENPPKS